MRAAQPVPAPERTALEAPGNVAQRSAGVNRVCVARVARALAPHHVQTGRRHAAARRRASRSRLIVSALALAVARQRHRHERRALLAAHRPANRGAPSARPWPSRRPPAAYLRACTIAPPVPPRRPARPHMASARTIERRQRRAHQRHAPAQCAGWPHARRSAALRTASGAAAPAAAAHEPMRRRRRRCGRAQTTHARGSRRSSRRRRAEAAPPNATTHRVRALDRHRARASHARGAAMPNQHSKASGALLDQHAQAVDRRGARARAPRDPRRFAAAIDEVEHRGARRAATRSPPAGSSFILESASGVDHQRRVAHRVVRRHHVQCASTDRRSARRPRRAHALPVQTVTSQSSVLLERHEHGGRRAARAEHRAAHVATVTRRAAAHRCAVHAAPHRCCAPISAPSSSTQKVFTAPTRVGQRRSTSRARATASLCGIVTFPAAPFAREQASSVAGELRRAPRRGARSVSGRPQCERGVLERRRERMSDGVAEHHQPRRRRAHHGRRPRRARSAAIRSRARRDLPLAARRRSRGTRSRSPPNGSLIGRSRCAARR